MNKTRIDITIDTKLLLKFRKKFVVKKGDLSNIIQELIIKKIKESNNGI
jgi:hypothetical protein